MNLLIAADHAGFELKEEIKKAAPSLGITFTDLGTHSTESVDYPDYANRVAEKMKGDANQLAVLICGSGIGISIAANRFSHVRAVLAESATVAKLGREHNHANVLCMGARIVNVATAMQILKAFIETQPDFGERHVRRVNQLSKKGI